jgi:phospholipase D-like protein
MRHGAVLTAVAGLLIALAGCHATSSGATGSTGKGGGQPGTAAAGTLSVLVEPRDGVGEIYRLISGARSSIDLTMYELRDSTAESDLAAAAARGVNVRVLLDRHLEKSRNAATYEYLSAHRVHVAWAPAGTTYHQKTLTVDGKTSLIMTLNMVTADYAGTRDFAVLDTDPPDVRDIEATFGADFAGHPVTPPDGDDLVWSPTNSSSSILAVIGAAKRTLAVENEEMGSTAVTSALASAARRGVNVEVVMTAASEWDSAFGELERAGVHVRLYPDTSRALYIHAKAVVADAGQPDEQLFTGSENFSTASLDRNRELGIRTTDRSVITAISAAITGDYAGATSSSPASSRSGGSSPSPAPSKSSASASGSLCGAPANPLGLTLCDRGQLVTAPPSGVCGYFRCISSFADGKGYMIECGDGTYSMSGGRAGVCNGHGGPGRPVRKN